MQLTNIISPSRLDITKITILMMSKLTIDVAIIPFVANIMGVLGYVAAVMSILASIGTLILFITRLKLIVKKEHGGSFIRYIKSMLNFKGFWKK